VSQTVFRDGDVTVTLTSDLEAMVRRLADQAAGGIVSVLEAHADEVVAKARADWYGPGGVERETGRSGDIVRRTTISEREVRVGVVSTDTRAAGKSGKLVPLYVHRPGRLSTEVREITQAEYYEAKRTGTGAALVFHAKRSSAGKGVEAGKYYRVVASERASDGRYLVPLLLTGPVKAKVKVLLPELHARIVARMNGGAGG